LRRLAPLRREVYPSIGPRGKESHPMMSINMLLVQPLIALIAGILILIIPRLLSYIVAIYLIIIGLSGLLSHLTR
jgi:Protein of unknown function (DUF3096)